MKKLLTLMLIFTMATLLGAKGFYQDTSQPVKMELSYQVPGDQVTVATITLAKVTHAVPLENRTKAYTIDITAENLKLIDIENPGHRLRTRYAYWDYNKTYFKPVTINKNYRYLPDKRQVNKSSNKLPLTS